MVPLGEVAALDRKAISPENIESGTYYLGLEDIEVGGQIAGGSHVAQGHLQSAKFAFTPEHVLYGKLRPYLAKIAAPTVAGVCSTDILPIRPGPHIARNYLLHYLRQPSLVARANSLSTGANLPRLNPKSLESIEVPLPSLDEQHRIAAILDKADALRTKRRQSIKHVEQMSSRLFDQRFGNQACESILADAISDLNGGRNILGSDDSKNSVRVLKISAVTSGRYIENESKPLPDSYIAPTEHIVREGDVLISRANTSDLVGASALVGSTNGNSALPDKLWRAVPVIGINPHFLLATLQSQRVRREISQRATGTGGSMKNISKPKFLSIPIHIPPPSEQDFFAGQLQGIDDVRDLQIRSLLELDNFFGSLQHRAFRGEL